MKYDFSLTERLETFWSNYANKKIYWEVPFKNAFSENSNNINNKFEFSSNFKWFNKGEINLKKTFFSGKKSSSCLISYYLNGLKIDISYANFLDSCSSYVDSILQIKNNSRIMIIGSASPETMTIITSSALSGKCHCVLFEDLSIDAILCRIKLFKPDLIYIRDTFCKNKLDEINKIAENDFSNINIETYGEIYSKKDFLTNELKNTNCENLISYSQIPELRIRANDLIFCLFTSGSTGTPKGIWHSFGGYLVYSLYTFEEFFLSAGAKNGIFCATDAAWINGHTYAIYGPLLSGTRTIFIDSLNNLQKPDQLANFLESTKPSFFYSSVTLLRAIRSISTLTNIRKASNSHENKLAGIGSCGEPLANEVAIWALDFFDTKNNYIVNTYFQTETAGVIVAPRIGDGNVEDFSTIGKPRFPLKIEINYKDNSLEIPVPWPGCFSKVTSDKKPNYWNPHNKYLLHDNGYYDRENFLYVGGRSDDVINISGHRVSSGEIESVFLKFDKSLRESAAVGIKDPILGNKIVLFFVSTNQKVFDSSLMKKFLVKNLSPFHRPWKIFKIECLPKTKSGKIARRILRDFLDSDYNDEGKDFSTIINYENFKLAFQELNYARKN